MPTEAPAYTTLVTVAGAQLPADVAQLLSGGYVDNSLNVPDLFVLHFSDDHGIVIDKAHLAIGAEVEVSVQPTTDSGPKTLLKGEITALETEIDAHGKHLIVRGFDKSHRLFRGTKVAAFVNVKPGDIAKQIASAAGLSAGTISSKGSVMEHVIQPGISDWDFLCLLAAGLGVEVSVVDGKLNFADPVEASTASGSDDSTRNALALEFGRNLLSLRASVTAADQVGQVEVRGWDPKQKQAVVGSAQAKTHSAAIDSLTPTALAGKFGSPKYIESNSTFDVQAVAQARADALVDRLAGSFAELDGVANGNPEMRAGKAITLTNVGTPFDGKYTLSSTRHDFGAESGYRVAFTVSNSSDRSLYGVSTGAGGTLDQDTASGVMPAVVTDLKDPDHLGRVKVKIPVLSDDLETGWARVVQVGAGDKHGICWLPEVNDEVLVVFGMGHIDEPYVLGGLFNGKDKPRAEFIDTSAGQVKRRELTGRTGMFIALVEESSTAEVHIETSDGQKLVITQQGDQSVSVEAAGPINLKTKKDVTIDASTGNITFKGQKVSIESTTDLQLKGMNVKLSADAQAELSASGPMAVKGAMVQIN